MGFNSGFKGLILFVVSILIRNYNTCKEACTQYGAFPGTLAGASVCRGEHRCMYVYVNSKFCAGWLTGSEVAN